MSSSTFDILRDVPVFSVDRIVEGGEQPSSPPAEHWTAADYDRYARTFREVMDFRSRPEWSPIASFEEAVDAYASNLGLSTSRTREERTMNISIKAPEFTEREREELTRFYYLVLQQGYANWPFLNARVVLWINGTARRIKPYRQWSLTEDHLYIGCSIDNGDDELADPITRLAIVTALMSLSGHTNNPELMALVERRFAQITQGNYQAMVAPLGQRADNRPVEQIAWTADGQLAAQLDGEWVRPLTGEPIEVGEGWVVLDVAEREARPLSSGQEEEIASTPVDSRLDQERFTAWIRTRGWATERMLDGRIAVPWGTEGIAQDEAESARQAGCLNIVVEPYNNGWAVTTRVEPLATQIPTLRDFAANYGWLHSTSVDGRYIIRFGSLELAQEQQALATSYGVPNVVLEHGGDGAVLTTNVLPEPPIPF